MPHDSLIAHACFRLMQTIERNEIGLLIETVAVRNDFGPQRFERQTTHWRCYGMHCHAYGGRDDGSVPDAKVMADLIRDDAAAGYDDKGYTTDVKKSAAEDAGVLRGAKEKAKPGHPLVQRQRAHDRRFGKGH